jgi:hypothetical protein
MQPLTNTGRLKPCTSIVAQHAPPLVARQCKLTEPWKKQSHADKPSIHTLLGGFYRNAVITVSQSVNNTKSCRQPLSRGWVPFFPPLWKPSTEASRRKNIALGPSSYHLNGGPVVQKCTDAGRSSKLRTKQLPIAHTEYRRDLTQLWTGPGN